MAPTLYISHYSPGSRAILMTAELLNLKLNLKALDAHNGDTKTPEFLKMNPQHTLPTLDDEGFYLWETHAILPYLVGKYGQDDSLYPKDLQKRAVIDQRMHFANSVLAVRLLAIIAKILKKEKPEEKDLEGLQTVFGFLESFLEKDDYLCGSSLTIADWANIVWVTPSITANVVDVEKFPKVAAWVSKLEALPCYSINREGLESSRAILMTAELLNLKLNVKALGAHNGDTTTPEFLKMNPQHTLPTLDDDGFYLWETHAILPYLVGKYGKDEYLYPKDLQKRAVVDQRLHFANSVLAARFMAIIVKLIKKEKPEEKDLEGIQNVFGFLESFLEKGDYLCGNSLTIADLANIIWASLAITANVVDVEQFPKVAAWVNKLEALPCYSINREGLERTRELYLYTK